MYQVKATVHYVDGTTADVVLTQWSIGQFAQYASRNGLKFDTENPGLMALVMARFQAYAELFRDPTKPRTTFDKWDLTVSEVEKLNEDEVVDPTQPPLSAE